MQCVLLCLISVLSTVSAQYDTPLNTTKTTVGWVNGPSYRSTSEIIFSCTLTMSLCVWSALHLNIPGIRESAARQWLRNTGWIVLGIFGPELIMFAAYKNYAAAKSLQSLMGKRSLCSKCEPKTIIRTTSCPTCYHDSHVESVRSSGGIYEWSILHGYYATMGGFVLELDDDSLASIFNKPVKKRWTITPQGLQLLADCGIYPSIEARDIKDKNKSDSLTKAIVLLQAGWMVIQTIARLAYSLPVTLLEVNTIGHVICALFIYLVWWKKPKEVFEPTTLKGSWIPALASYMVMSSDLDDTEGWREWATIKPPILPELSNIIFRRDQINPEHADGFQIDDSGKAPSPTTCERSEVASTRVHKIGFGSLSLTHGCDLTLTSIKRQKSFLHHLDQNELDTKRQRRRWRLALEAMELFPHLCCRLEDMQSCIESDLENYQPQVMLQERASNWPNKGAIPAFPGKLIGMALWLASITFGAVHVAAWNEFFPSNAEKWLWRSSSLYLVWAGSLWLMICFVATLSGRFDAVWDRCLTGRASKPVYTCLIPLCIFCGIAYAFARVFLVIESVIALRQMPPSMYASPDWPELIPHL